MVIFHSYVSLPEGIFVHSFSCNATCNLLRSSTCSIFFRRSKDMEMLAWTLSALRLRLSHGCVESRANMVWCGSHDVVWCPRVRLNIQESESTKLSCSLLFLGSYICCSSQNVAHLSGFAKQVVQEFSRYNNTLLLTVANELATWSNSSRFSVMFFSFGGSPSPAIFHWRERCESTIKHLHSQMSCLNSDTKWYKMDKKKDCPQSPYRSVTLLAIAKLLALFAWPNARGTERQEWLGGISVRQSPYPRRASIPGLQGQSVQSQFSKVCCKAQSGNATS